MKMIRHSCSWGSEGSCWGLVPSNHFLSAFYSSWKWPQNPDSMGSIAGFTLAHTVCLSPSNAEVFISLRRTPLFFMKARKQGMTLKWTIKCEYIRVQIKCVPHCISSSICMQNIVKIIVSAAHSMFCFPQKDLCKCISVPPWSPRMGADLSVDFWHWTVWSLGYNRWLEVAGGILSVQGRCKAECRWK